jgi:hypothetical protein
LAVAFAFLSIQPFKGPNHQQAKRRQCLARSDIVHHVQQRGDAQILPGDMTQKDVKQNQVGQAKTGRREHMRDRQIEQHCERREDREIDQRRRDNAGRIRPRQNHSGQHDHRSNYRDTGSRYSCGGQFLVDHAPPQQCPGCQDRYTREGDEWRQVHH